MPSPIPGFAPARPATPRPPWYADLLAAFCVVLVNGIAVVTVGYQALIAGWAANYGDEGGAESATGRLLIELAVLTLIATVAAFAILRARLIFAGVLQALVATALALVTLAGFASESRESEPAPAPPTSDYDDAPGGGPCRSGGDNDECLDTGG